MPRVTIAALMSLLAGTASAGAANLDALLWQARPVVIFASAKTDERVEEQLRLLDQRQSAVHERDIVVVTVWPDRVEMDGKSVTLKPRDVRRRFNVAENRFVVLLVGKDGGIKRGSHTVVEPESLFGQIDSMPMRQREMRAQGTQ